MLKLYENIRRYRKAAGLSQAELAQRTGYTDRSSIAKIEKGLVDLSQSKIKQFADVLGVTPGHLMGWDEKPAEDLQDMGALAAEVLMDPGALEIVQAYLAMDEADRQAVRDFMALSDTDRYAVRLVMASMSRAEKKTGAGVASVAEVAQSFDKA